MIIPSTGMALNELEIQRQQRFLDSIDMSMLVEKDHIPKRDDVYLKRLFELKEQNDRLFDEYKKSNEVFQERMERSNRWIWFGVGVWAAATLIRIIIDLARIFN